MAIIPRNPVTRRNLFAAGIFSAAAGWFGITTPGRSTTQAPTTPGVCPPWEVACLNHATDPVNDPNTWLHLGPRFHIGDGLVELERFDDATQVHETKVHIEFVEQSLTLAEVETLIGHLETLVAVAKDPTSGMARDAVLLAETRAMLLGSKAVVR